MALGIKSALMPLVAYGLPFAMVMKLFECLSIFLARRLCWTLAPSVKGSRQCAGVSVKAECV